MWIDLGKVAFYYVAWARPEKVREMMFANVGRAPGVPAIGGC